jgi:hypothetical protein
MKLPAGMLFTTNELFRTNPNAKIAFDNIVRDCALAAYRKDFEVAGDEEFARELELFILNRYALDTR